MKVSSLALYTASLVGLGIVSGMALSHHGERPKPVSPTQIASESVTDQPSEGALNAEPTVAEVERPAENTPKRLSPGAAPPVPATPTDFNSMPANLDRSLLDQAIDWLASSQITHEQKRTIWKQLQDRGKLDQAITELERRAADDPRSADIAAALGQAYLKKCGTLQDLREQAILAMQADKAFDTALGLDPANWEARFTKAVALSYWPPNLNKGGEVIQHFETLLQQQESQTPQSQFAETYLWLGDQYKKAGRAQDARAIWLRGAALFPNNEGLRGKLVSAQ